MKMSFSIFSVGDKGQVDCPKKIRSMQSIFDLAISTCMKHFTIEGPQTCNSS